MKDLLDWNLTQYAVFNKTDNYLLVCGVNFSETFHSEFFMGHGAVFDMKQGRHGRFKKFREKNLNFNFIYLF